MTAKHLPRQARDRQTDIGKLNQKRTFSHAASAWRRGSALHYERRATGKVHWRRVPGPAC
jgi:hypothetical protein